MVRAEQVRARALDVTAVAQRLILESRALRTQAPGGAASLRFFVLHGGVEGNPVKAWWLAGTLTTSRELRDRAELLVHLDERFELGPGDLSIAAALDDPLAALLTLVRACDRIRSVLVGPVMPLPPQIRKAS
jgi:hypothetical protein